MDNNVAVTLMQQIGRRAFIMLGAKDYTALKDGLQFKIGRNGKGVNLVRITLLPSDTYKVEAISRRWSNKTLENKDTVKGEASDVYVESLHTVIEQLTGMYTKL